jgi:hypothetical protein
VLQSSPPSSHSAAVRIRMDGLSAVKGLEHLLPRCDCQMHSNSSKGPLYNEDESRGILPFRRCATLHTGCATEGGSSWKAVRIFVVATTPGMNDS